jgi:hypothetical protein
LKKQDEYEKQINTINNSKSSYLYETQLREKEKQDLVKEIDKLKYFQDYSSNSSAKEIREYKDRLEQEKEKAKEEIDKLIKK